MRIGTIAIAAAILFASNAFGQAPKEQLLVDHAYNPIPSPDGTKIAYVHTGGHRGITFGLGRGSLVSEVNVMDSNGRVLTPKPLADAFLAGWTPDGKNLICYRDFKYYLISLDASKSQQSQIPYDEKSQSWIYNSERGTYVAGIDGMLLVKHLYDPSRGIIRTADKEVARNESAEMGDLLVPSPNGRYIADVDVDSVAGHWLWVYDLETKTWAKLGQARVHPAAIGFSGEWDWMKATWDPWFADSSRLAYIGVDSIVISTPDGKEQQFRRLSAGEYGLARPSPDGEEIVYVSYEGHPLQANRQVTIWKGTIWVSPSTPDYGPAPRIVSTLSAGQIYDLNWLNNDEIVFDRSADDMFQNGTGIWKVRIHQ